MRKREGVGGVGKREGWGSADGRLGCALPASVVYAYTEFSEGGSLFPTVADGYGRLQAFQAVFGNRSGAPTV